MYQCIFGKGRWVWGHLKLKTFLHIIFTLSNSSKLIEKKIGIRESLLVINFDVKQCS